MNTIFEIDGAEIILWTAVLAALIAVAVFLILKIRQKALQSEPTRSELLTKFRDFYSRGVLSDEEFRTIKTLLATQIQEELKENDIKS